MADPWIHKYKAQFGQPESYQKRANPQRTLPISSELAGDTRYEDDQYHNVVSQDVIEVSDHNMTFTIRKTKDVGEGDNITFYNLSENARKRLEATEAGNPLFTLYAGYESDAEVPLIFEGEVIAVTQEWNGNTLITKCTLKTAATNIKEAYTSRSYRAGEKLSTIIKDCFKDVGLAQGVLSLGNAANAVADLTIPKPLVINGTTVDWLRRFGKQNGFKFTIADGVANFFKADEEITGMPAHLISSATNMIGSPNPTSSDTSPQEKQPANKQTLSVMTTLNGAYKIGDLVALESRFYNGSYAIESIEHSGTYEGSDWCSKLELKPAEGWENKK